MSSNSLEVEACVSLWGLILIGGAGLTVVTVGHLCKENAAAAFARRDLHNVLIIFKTVSVNMD